MYASSRIFDKEICNCKSLRDKPSHSTAQWEMFNKVERNLSGMYSNLQPLLVKGTLQHFVHSAERVKDYNLPLRHA